MIRRYAHGAILPGQARPQPTYPEYAQLRADAEQLVVAEGRFVDPRKLAQVARLARSWEWKVAVLGHDGDGTQARIDMHLLLLADERGLNPPAPQWLVEMRREADGRDADRRAARAARADADEITSRAALAASVVELAVRRSGTARPRHGFMHHLGHLVPAVHAYSGFGRRRRRHRADRALCESEARTRALDLSGGSDGPATCVNCLKYAPLLRQASV